MYVIHCGDIGADPREYEFEPMTAPSVPEPVVIPTPEPVPVGRAA